MYKEIARLILYRDLGKDNILLKLSGIFQDYEQQKGTPAELITRIYEQMKALLIWQLVMDLTKISGTII